jgi:redox-sensitive bicupin YhaK (pirin superfamily)
MSFKESEIRRAKSRGGFDHGWLKTFHTFSFGDYYDPKNMGVGYLRVINEDWVLGGEGFPTHGHKDMEIVTYIIEGALEHRDSTGGHGVIRPGEIQKMSAGRGIRHSEFNALKDQTTHLYQIWILPDRPGIEPGYEQTDFNASLNSGKPTLLVSPTGRDGSIVIRQKTELAAKRWVASEEWKTEVKSGDFLWVQVVKNEVQLNGVTLHAGDGWAAIAGANDLELTLNAEPTAEALVFRMWK